MSVAARVRALHEANVKAFESHHRDSLPKRRGHADVLKANTGWKLDPQDWVKRWHASALLARQSEQIADALGRMGVDVRSKSEITVVGAVTGKVEELTAYKAVRFLPAVAARDRRPILNGMRYFIENHPNSRFFRYVVMTASEPVPFGGKLRKSITGLSRRISKWAAEARTHDVEVLYRGIEYTRATAAERDADAMARWRRANPEFIGPPVPTLSLKYGADTILYHVHANVLTWPTRAMKDEEWQGFLKMTWRAVKAHWRDNGTVQDPAELVKYCMKPGDLDEATDHEILWLYEETRRLKICQPLGPFAAFMREMEEGGEKVVRIRRGARSELVRVSKAERLDHSKREEREPSLGVPPSNILLGVSLPQWRWSPWAEPMLLVQRYDPNPVRKSDRDRLEEMDVERAFARKDWDASGAPHPKAALAVAEAYGAGNVTAMPSGKNDPQEAAEAGSYRVHTCRPTVRSEAEGSGTAWSSTASPPERTGEVVLLKLPGGPPVGVGDVAIDVHEDGMGSRAAGV